ncbi:hypothetical protein MNBD_GAMMA12-3241 [hydrothermal vent metagenome]|uniref:Uncharacterized protein n=1 Tax=hydrothermal vent metagenome TaxID=652676 RepID=A0A3B0YDJ1_9ZZZZ
MNKWVSIIGVSTTFLLPITGAYSNVTEASTMKKGITFCGGNHFTRASGTERSFTVYQLRNYSRKALQVSSIKVYDANGTIIRNFPSLAPFPGSFKALINARGASTLNTATFLPSNPVSPRPFTIQINWAYLDGKRGIPLLTNVIRHFKAVSNNASRASFSASSTCFVRAN